MYRLMYRNPMEPSHWIVVSTQPSLEEINKIWNDIFWSIAEKDFPVQYGGLEDFLKIENLAGR